MDFAVKVKHVLYYNQSLAIPIATREFREHLDIKKTKQTFGKGLYSIISIS